MPISFINSSGIINIHQTFDSPTIYLDHWALCTFSEDIKLQDRFVEILKSKNGTLLVSIFSFLEFVNTNDIRHSKDAEQFLNRVLPNIFFSDFATNIVEKKESTMPNNKNRFWPSADLATLKNLADNFFNSQELPMNGMISRCSKQENSLLKCKEEIIINLRSLTGSIFLDQTFINKARYVMPNNERTRTAIILGELIRDFILDKSSVMKDNDIIDLFHAWTSINCCDYSLLDNAWMERANKITNRINKSQINMPIAKCYSEKNKGIDTFLNDLEAFDLANIIPARP